MRAKTSLAIAGGIALGLAPCLAGCGKIKQHDTRETDKPRVEAKRQKAACASSAVYDKLKGQLFDQAISQHEGDHTNLDVLSDYSIVRMENVVVQGFDPELDITRCNGRLVLVIPPGSERGFEGERTLQADIDYTAQAAADGSGFVYRLTGAEPIVTKLAAFKLASAAYRPPAAIEEGGAGSGVSAPMAIGRPDVPTPPPSAATPSSSAAAGQRPPSIDRGQQYASRRGSDQASSEPAEPAPVPSGNEGGEAIVRAFYLALGAGDGATASAHIIPEKRSSRAFSPEAMSRFYGRLPEPIRLTGITPLARDKYRVSYRYSAGRSHCDGSAIVSVTNRGDSDLIRSIQALNGC